MADQTTDITTAATQEQLTETYENIRGWSDMADHLDATADEARRLARHLEDELISLRAVFEPIRALHSPTAWQGRSGDQSRRRLDRHEDDHAAELRKIDRLVDDLQAQALLSLKSAETFRDSVSSARRHAWILETELRHVERFSA